MGGADGKASIERLCLSPYVDTFNSKVIKGFVPEQRSRYVFFVFPMFYVYIYTLWTFYVCFPYSCMGMVHIYELGKSSKIGSTNAQRLGYLAAVFDIWLRVYNDFYSVVKGFINAKKWAPTRMEPCALIHPAQILFILQGSLRTTLRNPGLYNHKNVWKYTFC